MNMNIVNVTIIGIILMIISIVTAVSLSNWNTNKLKADAIKNGATPQQLICAFDPPHDYSTKLTLCGNFDFKPKEPK